MTSAQAVESLPLNFSWLETICFMDDVFQRHLLSFLTNKDLANLEASNQSLRKRIETSRAWKYLCERDFVLVEEQECLAPVYSEERRSFDRLISYTSWKLAYQAWAFWDTWTCSGARAEHLVQAIHLWDRCKAWLRSKNLENVLHSLSDCPSKDTFAVLAGKAPSSWVAVNSVHGGQNLLTPNAPDTAFFAGILGGYSCYNMFHSVRLINLSALAPHVITEGSSDSRMCFFAMSPGHPRSYLFIRTHKNNPEGQIIMKQNINHIQNGPDPHEIVCHGGFLQYFQSYVENLESGVFEPVSIIPDIPTTRGIGLFPNAGPAVSCAVTRGIEVRASARWLPDDNSLQMGLNFAYSIRIRMVAQMPDAPTCQLVSRHWEFKDGTGFIRRVDGEAVIGKQPLFFMEDNGESGYVDLGHAPAADGSRHMGIFYYQSQSGPVRGTTIEDTRAASVQGTFSFVPGSIEEPKGPEFRVTVASFPLLRSLPFY
jgi:F-box protein 3